MPLSFVPWARTELASVPSECPRERVKSIWLLFQPSSTLSSSSSMSSTSSSSSEPHSESEPSQRCPMPTKRDRRGARSSPHSPTYARKANVVSKGSVYIKLSISTQHARPAITDRFECRPAHERTTTPPLDQLTTMESIPLGRVAAAVSMVLRTAHDDGTTVQAHGADRL